MDTKLPMHQCDFCKGYSAHHCLVFMLEKRRATLDKRGCSRVLLTGLSTAFDCLSNELLIVKIETYGFDYM